MTDTPPVRQMRLVVTAPDYDEALHFYRFYRDVPGLRQEAAFAAAGGHVTILDAGRATLEITDPPHAAYIDEVEVGRWVAATSGSPSRSTTPPPPRSGWRRRGRR